MKPYIPFTVFFLIFLITTVCYFMGEFAVSVVPGWHTPMFSPFMAIGIVHYMLLLLACIGYLVLGVKNRMIATGPIAGHFMITIAFFIVSRYSGERFLPLICCIGQLSFLSMIYKRIWVNR